MEPEPPVGWPFGKRAKEAARRRLRDLIASERKRAQFHINLIRQSNPTASQDRIAHVILDRWVQVAAIEGGLTGAFGFIGVPINAMLFTYCQLAVVVSIAEAYGTPLSGETGEETLLSLLSKVHGMGDVLRASPRVLGAIAKAIALKHGLGTLSRFVPMIAAPISAKLNERHMKRVGSEAMRRFGNVVLLPP